MQCVTKNVQNMYVVFSFLLSLKPNICYLLFIVILIIKKCIAYNYSQLQLATI